MLNQSSGMNTNNNITITVDTTAGFPDTGTLLIGTEELTYSSKSATTFVINGRVKMELVQQQP